MRWGIESSVSLTPIVH
uniref:Uncharacterized protein n=1 Tax=Nymphaea colorata TaxID=210225 RepID=A0A5K1DU40_9MAGN